MLTKLFLLGLVIALSPITVIPAVLVLHAPRPRPASLAFLGGWLFDLFARYDWVWLGSMGLALSAALMVLTIDETRGRAAPRLAPA